MYKSLIKVLSLSALLFINAQCGGATDANSDLDVEILPEEPVVFGVDVTINSGGEDTTVTAPWTAFNYKLINNSDSQQITIINMELKILTAGGIETEAGTVDPGQLEHNYLHTLCPGQETSVGTTTNDCDLSGTTDADFGSAKWYMGNLPTPNPTKYSASLTLYGWYGGVNSAEKKFKKRITFTVDNTD